MELKKSTGFYCDKCFAQKGEPHKPDCPDGAADADVEKKRLEDALKIQKKRIARQALRIAELEEALRQAGLGNHKN